MNANVIHQVWHTVWSGVWFLSVTTIWSFAAFGVASQLPSILTTIALTWQPDWFASLSSIFIVFGVIVAFVIILYPPPKRMKNAQKNT